ncbi:Uncharacterised protein [Vibrio cholerae]|uniref:Uncharacterized protein n=1 Tax=Vibrio cholerae TaxID=666 RepID=A0A655WAT1_VIBCL|nr:Uncharacterised protein [Vibrio cholerae]
MFDANALCATQAGLACARKWVPATKVSVLIATREFSGTLTMAQSSPNAK